MALSELAVKLFFQLAFILFFCRIITYFGKRYLKQTAVVCEMVAGVIIGPSCFGLLFPEFQGWLFPKEQLLLANGHAITNPSMIILYAISQVGLVFFMFVVGMEFNINLFKQQVKPASIISIFGIIIPFTLGIILIHLFNNFGFFQDNVSPGCKAFFMGIALSITAFPMMARILEENKISTTRFGTLALAAGSMDDLAAWIMLAILLSFIKNDITITFFALGGLLLFIVLLFLIKRPLQWLLSKRFDKKEKVSTQALSTAIIILMLAACFTDHIGIYSVFGAFLAGAMIPRNKLINKLKSKISSLTIPILLPIFFVYSGLNTQIALLLSPKILFATVCIITAAIIGKGLGCMLAARISGETWRDSTKIGTLMNARGLMELILLNIGLQANIITPTLFTILVLMAVITTVMTAPLFHLFQEKELPILSLQKNHQETEPTVE